MSGKLLTFLGLATLATLIGCGAEERGSTPETPADSAMLTFLSDVGEAGGQGELGAFNSQYPTLGGLVGLPGATQPSALAEQLLRRLTPSPFAAAMRSSSTCVPVLTGVDSTGAPIDTDGDGIPDDFTFDLGDACVTEDSAGTFRITSSGSIRVQDTDLGFRSFLVTLDELRVVAENLVTGTVTTGTMDGTEAGRFTPTLAERTVALAVSDRTVSGDRVFEDTSIVTRRALYAPDGGQTLVLGALLPNGRLVVDTDLHVINGFQGRSFDVVFGTPTPLHYTQGCGSQFDAGLLRGLLNGGTSTGFDLLWTGCAPPAVTLFGVTEG